MVPVILLLLLGLTPLCATVKPSDTFTGYISSQGYPAEHHSVTTDDGYILGLFRMPSKVAGAPVVLLQHGILASSWCWVVNRKNATSAFALWDLGYDVWLSNSRGNDFSTNHTTLSPSSNAFWNYTFGDMPLDVLANTRYILNHTAKPSLSYVGWSQGTTQMFMAALDYPAELTEKINLFVALSPVVYLVHSTSEVFQACKTFNLANLLYAVYKKGFLTGFEAEHEIEELACKITLGALCKFSVDAFCGVSDLDDKAMIENLAAHFPAGTSMKDLVHYSQYLSNASFAKYDYGKRGNLQEYGEPSAPVYDLSAFPPIPTALFHGTKDALVAAPDLAHEQQQFAAASSKPVVFDRSYEGYSHVTWFVGKEGAGFEYFADLAVLLKQYAK